MIYSELVGLRTIEQGRVMFNFTNEIIGKFLRKVVSVIKRILGEVPKKENIN